MPREVVFLGICGPSASGKSTAAKAVAAAFDSPVLPISADWFFKKPQDFQSCTKRGHCWELPSSVDSGLLAKQLKYLKDTFASAKIIPSTKLRATRGREFALDVVVGGDCIKVGQALGEGPVFIVVEGFLLFADKAVVELLSKFVMLDLDGEVGCRRRYKREGREGDPVISNPVFAAYREETYMGHIYPHYLEFVQLQLDNCPMPPCRVDANVDNPDKVARAVIAAFELAVGESLEASSRVRSDLSSSDIGWIGFSGNDSAEHIYQWLLPARTVGGSWWLASDGMHEIRKPGGRETKESPSCIEIVGRSHFVMWQYGHVYCLDNDSGCVFVFTGKEQGITHVARAAAHGPADVSELIEFLEPQPSEKLVGMRRLGVNLSTDWNGKWRWDERVTGFSGCFTLGRHATGEHFVIEDKLIKETHKRCEWRAIAITAEALVLPKFGHLYLLDPSRYMVYVWNGRGLNYIAHRE